MPGRTSKLSTRSSSPSPSEGDFQKPTEKKKTCQLFNKGNWWFLFILKHHWIHELKNTREFSGLFVSGIQFDKSSQIRICFSRSKHPSPSMAPFSYFFTNSIPPAAGFCFVLMKSKGKSISFVSLLRGVSLKQSSPGVLEGTTLSFCWDSWHLKYSRIILSTIWLTFFSCSKHQLPNTFDIGTFASAMAFKIKSHSDFLPTKHNLHCSMISLPGNHHRKKKLSFSFISKNRTTSLWHYAWQYCISETPPVSYKSIFTGSLRIS